MNTFHAVIVVTLVSGLAAAFEQLNATSPQPAAPAARTPAAAPLVWPGAVEAAFRQKYPKATVKAVLKEVAAGKTMYEVESVDSGRRRNIDYNPDGTIIRYEEELAPGEVPAAVRAALKVRYPAATVTLWERLYTTADNSANYECHLRDAAVGEAVLTPDGKWISPKGAR